MNLIVFRLNGENLFGRTIIRPGKVAKSIRSETLASIWHRNVRSCLMNFEEIMGVDVQFVCIVEKRIFYAMHEKFKTTITGFFYSA